MNIRTMSGKEIIYKAQEHKENGGRFKHTNYKSFCGVSFNGLYIYANLNSGGIFAEGEDETKQITGTTQFNGTTSKSVLNWILRYKEV